MMIVRCFEGMTCALMGRMGSDGLGWVGGGDGEGLFDDRR